MADNPKGIERGGFQNSRYMILYVSKDPEASKDDMEAAACLETTSLTIENEEVAVDCKDKRYRELLSGGTNSIDLEGEGAYRSGCKAANIMTEAAIKGDIIGACMEFADSEEFIGPFKITNYEREGDNDTATNFTAEFSSAGEIDWKAAGEADMDGAKTSDEPLEDD